MAYVRQGRHGAVGGTDEVHVDDPGELLRRRLLERRVERHRSRMHPRIEPAELLHRSVGHCFHLVEDGGVCHHGDGFRRRGCVSR